jgi:hypothetical protein
MQLATLYVDQCGAPSLADIKCEGQILGSIVILSCPLSADSLATLLHMPKQDVDQTLEELHAILNILVDRSRLLYLHHPSFCAFLA